MSHRHREQNKKNDPIANDPSQSTNELMSEFDTWFHIENQIHFNHRLQQRYTQNHCDVPRQIILFSFVHLMCRNRSFLWVCFRKTKSMFFSFEAQIVCNFFYSWPWMSKLIVVSNDYYMRFVLEHVLPIYFWQLNFIYTNIFITSQHSVVTVVRVMRFAARPTYTKTHIQYTIHNIRSVYSKMPKTHFMFVVPWQTQNPQNVSPPKPTVTFHITSSDCRTQPNV